MSEQYDNTNRWVLFKNDRKDRDTLPDYSGTINVDGVDYYLDAWLKEGKKGKFFSGKVKRKDAPRESGRSAPPPGRQPDPFDDTPF